MDGKPLWAKSHARPDPRSSGPWPHHVITGISTATDGWVLVGATVGQVYLISTGAGGDSGPLTQSFQVTVTHAEVSVSPAFKDLTIASESLLRPKRYVDAGSHFSASNLHRTFLSGASGSSSVRAITLRIAGDFPALKVMSGGQAVPSSPSDPKLFRVEKLDAHSAHRFTF